MLNWCHYMWFGYFWPSLKGNGPEAIAQTVVYGVIGYAVYPPFRNWVNRRFSSLHEKHDDLHAKIDHIITHHPEIPEYQKDK